MANQSTATDAREVNKALVIIAEMADLRVQRDAIDRKLVARFNQIRGIGTVTQKKRTTKPVAKAGGTGLASRVFSFLQSNPTTTYNAGEIAAAVKYKGDQQMVWATLSALMDAGKVTRPSRGRYQVAKSAVAQ